MSNEMYQRDAIIAWAKRETDRLILREQTSLTQQDKELIEDFADALREPMLHAEIASSCAARMAATVSSPKASMLGALFIGKIYVCAYDENIRKIGAHRNYNI